MTKRKGEMIANKGRQTLDFFWRANSTFRTFWPHTGKSDLNIWKDSYRVANVQNLHIQDLLNLQDKPGELIVAQPHFSLKLNPY
jgi:hypothetical protein